MSLHLYENELLGEAERVVGAADLSPRADVGPSARRRLFPLLLLAICGAAFALAQVDVKEALLTGRSVAHSPGR